MVGMITLFNTATHKFNYGTFTERVFFRVLFCLPFFPLMFLGLPFMALWGIFFLVSMSLGVAFKKYHDSLAKPATSAEVQSTELDELKAQAMAELDELDNQLASRWTESENR